MNLISNMWKHPRTSAAGILISVATVAGVLAQQGITLGAIGGGSIVSLAGALATAMLGLLARDPGAVVAQPASAPAAVPAAMPSCEGECSSSSSSSRSDSGATAKLSAWLLIVLLLPLPWLQGCTGNQVARDIVNWTPSLQSAVATVDSTAALIAPADAAIFASATAGFDAASNLLVTQARDYLANPSSGILAQLQRQVVVFQQQVNAALLSAAHLVNANSREHAMTALQAVATAVTAILALVQSVSTQADVARMAADSPVKLAAVETYLDDSSSARLVAAHYNEPMAQARAQMAEAQRLQFEAGF
jgi:hypothetical protein